MSHSRLLFTRLLCHHLFDNTYTLFSVLGWFRLILLYYISVWKIGRNDPAFMTFSLSVLGFFIFPHRLLVDQT